MDLNISSLLMDSLFTGSRGPKADTLVSIAKAAADDDLSSETEKNSKKGAKKGGKKSDKTRREKRNEAKEQMSEKPTPLGIVEIPGGIRVTRSKQGANV